MTLFGVAGLQQAYLRTHGSFFIYGGNTIWDFLPQLGMASNWLRTQPITFNGPVWSVSAEVLAYLFFFFAAYCFEIAIPHCIAIVLAAIIMLFLMPKQPVIWCICFFFTGGFVFLSRVKTWSKVLLMLVMTVLFVGSGFFSVKSDFSDLIMAFSASSIAVLIFAQADTLLRLDLSRIGWMGNLTYASYLIHFPVQITFVLIVDRLGIGRAIFLSPSMLVLYLSTIMVLSVLVYQAFELPAQRAVRTWWSSRGRLVRAN